MWCPDGAGCRAPSAGGTEDFRQAAMSAGAWHHPDRVTQKHESSAVQTQQGHVALSEVCFVI